jgi:hypothetical protein
MLVGAGLPQLRGRMGRAKSYAERLFDFSEIGPLDPSAAKRAISKPAEDQDVVVEKDALDRIMAELGAGPHRSGAIADLLGREVSSLGPTRAQLIYKGMIWSPYHGDTAFTVPLFDGFMHRVMQGDDWKEF